MASHFKWYPSSEEVVVPWNARYSFPSQANKAVKITPRIPPKNGSIFRPGQTFRLEFPAQGYVNPINTTLAFDVTLSGYGTMPANVSLRFQNNIQSIFNRVTIKYGATPLEDIINYNQIVRSLTEWTSTNQHGTFDQTSISEGIGGIATFYNALNGDAASGDKAISMNQNVRQKLIQGLEVNPNTDFGGSGNVPNLLKGNATSATGASYSTRRYQVNLACGLLTQDKLLPVKFMASQLSIEITLEQASTCIYQRSTGASGTGTAPDYTVSNIALIPEILEFDSSYDAMFLRGLQDGGVPIKFSSWHTYQFTTGSSSTVNLQVQERSRSVKALFAVQTQTPTAINVDSHATLFDSATYLSGGSTMQEYQWRIGGRYFPASPVQLSLVNGGSSPNGGSEAFVELQKALNIVGDYRLSSSANTLNWAVSRLQTSGGTDNTTAILPVTDYDHGLIGYDANGRMLYAAPAYTGATSTVGLAGTIPSCCYASAIDLETSNGVEISGLNAEEQSDISFIGKWSANQISGYAMTVFAYYDSMLILRENNVLELIQ
jgi:hypothetical protein